MSSLQVGLAIAGGVILAGVVAYNAWNTRRSVPKQAQPGAQPETVAPPQERVEPTIEGSVPETEPERVEPAFESAAALGTSVTAEKRCPLDALIDAIAPVALDGHVVSGDALLAAMPATRRVGSKPFMVEAKNEMTGQWEFPVAGQRYRALQAGVQLANRAGPLNEIEFSEFVMKTQRFADAIGGAPDFPDMLNEVGRARELDQFASGHDAQLGFTLRARGSSWSPGFVQQQAAQQGFVRGVVPGKLLLPGRESGAPPMLELSFDAQAALAEDPTQAAVRVITLNLDVPQVDRQEGAFDIMRQIAHALAHSMGGVITDDAGQTLRAETIDSIGADLSRLYDTLDQYDLSAGSPQARRLFS